MLDHTLGILPNFSQKSILLILIANRKVAKMSQKSNLLNLMWINGLNLTKIMQWKFHAYIILKPFLWEQFHDINGPKKHSADFNWLKTHPTIKGRSRCCENSLDAHFPSTNIYRFQCYWIPSLFETFCHGLKTWLLILSSTLLNLNSSYDHHQIYRQC